MIKLVKHPVTGELISPARHKGDTHSTMRFDETKVSIRGFGAYKNKAVFLTMRKEDMEKFAKEYNLNYDGAPLVGNFRVVTQEALIGTTPNAKPVARLDANRQIVGVMTHGGKPIFRNVFLSDVDSDKDIILDRDPIGYTVPQPEILLQKKELS